MRAQRGGHRGLGSVVSDSRCICHTPDTGIKVGCCLRSPRSEAWESTVRPKYWDRKVRAQIAGRECMPWTKGRQSAKSAKSQLLRGQGSKHTMQGYLGRG